MTAPGSGHDGADIFVRVPVGTQVLDPATGDLLHDLTPTSPDRSSSF